MPPRLSSTRAASGAAKSSTSAIGTSGAPCPPAATSRARKPLTTRTPNRSASTAGSPSCQVTGGGSCQMVCPGKAMRARSEAGVRAWASSDLHRLRGPLGEPDVQPRQRGRSGPGIGIERLPDLGALVVGVGTGDEIEQGRRGWGRRAGPAPRPSRRARCPT